MALIEERFFQEPVACGNALALDLTACLAQAIDQRGQASMAVSGGTTPKWVYPVMATQEIPWQKVMITLTDERWINPDHEDSNERIVRDMLIAGKAKKAMFSGLKNDADSPEAGQKNCEEQLRRFLFPLDAVFLGIGEDGHIASLFPGFTNPGSDDHCQSVAAPSGSHPRMSLTSVALLNSRRIFIVLTGKEKRSVYKQAKHQGPVQTLPLRLVLHQERVPVTVYLSEKS